MKKTQKPSELSGKASPFNLFNLIRIITAVSAIPHAIRESLETAVTLTEIPNRKSQIQTEKI
jgi:hypothetical protein